MGVKLADIILIVCDNLGTTHMSLYWHHRDTLSHRLLLALRFAGVF